MSEIDDAFEETDVLSTPEVSALLDVSQARARAFADENGVHRVGPAFAWSKDDVEAFADELEQDEEDELDELEEADGDDDELKDDDDDEEE